MNIIILPLLVISQLNLSNDLWRFGPEISYNVTYHSKTIPKIENVSSRMAVYDMTTMLKCRPRTPKILNCHLEQPIVHVGVINTSNPNHVEMHLESDDEGLNKFNFEMKFNRFGIKELIVPSSIQPVLLDKVRAIVNQFHSGIDFSERTEGTYRTWENFTTGDCFTSYTIKFSDKSIINKNTKQGKLKWEPDISNTIINKTRNLEKCRVMAPYFLGNKESWKDTPEFQTIVKSSKSLIRANRTAFISTTETSVEMTGPRIRPQSTVLVMNEIMTVAYDSVAPAKNEILKIEEPAPAGIVSGKWLFDEFSEENDVDE